jgi:RHS repeat-associated protein
LKYYDPRSGAEPSYSGNISEWRWKHANQSAANSYAFTYDGFSRLTGYDHLSASSISATGWSTPTKTFREHTMNYDRNGNILSLTRAGIHAASGAEGTDVLGYTYTGNQLASASHTNASASVAAAGSKSYSYDDNGNMTNDERESLNYSYNFLNLIDEVDQGSNVRASYSWLADGTKTSVQESGDGGFVYLGSLVYMKSGSSYALESASFGGGRLVASGSTMTPHYQITDHLGSVRVVFSDRNTILSQNDFYAYGKRHVNSNLATHASNRYLFNGKENQTTGNLKLLDYGWRMYDPDIARWTRQDRFAEKYLSETSYSFVAGNPIRYVDHKGDSISVAQEYRVQFMSDMRNVFGDNTDLFSFNSSGNWVFDGKSSDLTREQRDIFRGMNTLMKSKTNYGVSYESSYTSRDGSTEIDVDADTGGAMFYAPDNMIVISPNISAVEVLSVELGHSSFMQHVMVQQNTTSGLFHEFGEASLGNSPNRTGAITYENIVRRFIGLPYRPLDASHPTINR